MSHKDGQIHALNFLGPFSKSISVQTSQPTETFMSFWEGKDSKKYVKLSYIKFSGSEVRKFKQVFQISFYQIFWIVLLFSKHKNRIWKKNFGTDWSIKTAIIFEFILRNLNPKKMLFLFTLLTFLLIFWKLQSVNKLIKE